jgi:hypothetical protein
MTKNNAINILANIVWNDIQAGDFWNDPAYALEIQALKTLGYKIPETNVTLRPEDAGPKL